MKQFILIIIACLFINIAEAQDTLKVDSKIKDVTLYKVGAQIKRNARKFIPKGRRIIILTGLSHSLDKNTIKVTAGKNVTVISVSHRTNFLSKKNAPDQVKFLEKKQTRISDSLKLYETYLDILSDERKMLQMNRSIAGNQTGIDIENLKASYKFYKSKIIEIEMKSLKYDAKIANFNNGLSSISKQLHEMNIPKKKTTGEIVVELSSDLKHTANIHFEYFVYNAGWKPYYDIRVKDINKPVKMVYNAKVYQNTGIDWKNVKLSISTGKPNQNAFKPILNPYYLGRINPYVNTDMEEIVVTAYGVQKQEKLLQGKTAGVNISSASGSPGSSARVLLRGYSDIENVEVLKGTSAISLYGSRAANGAIIITTKRNKYKLKNKLTIPMNIKKNEINREFKIKIPYTVMSNNKEYNVRMTEFKLPTEYKYFTVPKLEEKVYLTAQITNWQDFGIMSGNANVFFKDTYSGKTFFNTKTVNDTLNISLGVDNDIIIERKSIKEFCKTNYNGSTRKDKKAIKITLKNLKKYPVNVIVEDQFPVTQFSAIKVKKINKSGAKENEDTGELKWDIELKPLKSEELILEYSIKYPKHMRLAN